ncbi:MAG: 2-hydroxyacid dehydrogenase [Rhabdochlamydiaceae bacterium]|nr:2-hydroxyacid dehydrogenase [Rhabdochlamydiaceae bacterium]
MKIAFFNAKPYDINFFTEANASFGFDIHYFDVHLSLKTCSLAKGHQAVCVFVNDTITKEIIDCLLELNVGLIALRSSGYNHVDLQAAQGKIPVVRVPRYSPFSVAEHAVALMLCLNRKLHRAYVRTRENNFSIKGLLGFDMHGKTAGVIGCGQIGAAVVQMLKGFGMHVLGYDIDKSQVEQAGCAYVDLPTLYKTSDIITLHCPLSSKTQHMIDSKAFSLIKEGALLINTARGGLIDTEALIEALKSQKLSAAGLDVYEGESPYFYEDLSSSFIPDDTLARLQTFPNVLITSHQGFFTKEALQHIAETTLKNIHAYSERKPLMNQI